MRKGLRSKQSKQSKHFFFCEIFALDVWYPQFNGGFWKMLLIPFYKRWSLINGPLS